MPEILTDFSNSVVSKAVEDNGVDCCLSWAAWPGMELRQDEQTVWTITDVPFPFFNNVFRARISDGEVDHAIAKATTRARDRNVPMFWWTGPTTEPDDLGKRLEANGFAHGFEAAAMAVELDALEERKPAPENLAIEEVSDVEMLKAWCSVMTDVYAFPDFAAETWYNILAHLGLGPEKPLRHFLALVGNIPVATASLFLGAGIAGVSSIATLPDHRRQGIATALVLETLQVAKPLGYRIGTLFSSPAGVEMYRKIGFREFSKGNCYVWGADP